jgi:CHAT domain-containing protein
MVTRVIFVFLFLFSFHAQAQNLASLLQQGQENMALGHYYEASKQLQLLEQLALQQQDERLVTLAESLQGYIAIQQQDHSLAEKLLTMALERAQQKSWNDLAARSAAYLGELNEGQKNFTKAQQYFSLAQSLAEKLTDKSFLVNSLVNQAKLAILEKQYDAAWQTLQEAKILLEKVPASQDSSQLWLSVGYQLLQHFVSVKKGELQLEKHDQFAAQTFYALDKALVQAKNQGQLRTQALSLKYLAKLYSQQKRIAEAIKLSEEGILMAQKENHSEDLLLDLEWMLGVFYKAENKPQQAIAAYRQALTHLEKIRLDIPVSYEGGRSSFKTTFAPLYLGLADLLLEQATKTTDQAQQKLLQESQNIAELFKKSELEDYFQSRCEIAATPINLQKKDPHAVAIYPILLKDRLEIIVYAVDGLHQFTQKVGSKEVTQQARTFSAQLSSYSDFEKEPAQLLYQWIIKPILPLLQKQQIDTLIYIPDGALRLVPLAALYDGEKFLIEDYAVVTSPGITMFDSSAGQYKSQDILLAGMSKPGDVINDLPDVLLSQLIDSTSLDSSEKRDLKHIVGEKNLSSEEKRRKLRSALQNEAIIKELATALALPGVEVEIKELAKESNMPYLLNEDFSVENFIHTAESHPYRVLHIASHGFFGSKAEESFIMTHNKVLNMNSLESFLNSNYFKENPIDLLTLSACQTAEGDDRSPLGISGVAIKSKVRSALGSLWTVSDDAAPQLMSSFYHELLKNRLGKAKALQQAEIQLLKQEKFSNPSFWSPFILVGDWL